MANVVVPVQFVPALVKVAVIVAVPVAVGVPVMAPVVELIIKPAGKLVALQVYAAPAPAPMAVGV